MKNLELHVQTCSVNQPNAKVLLTFSSERNWFSQAGKTFLKEKLSTGWGGGGDKISLRAGQFVLCLADSVYLEHRKMRLIVYHNSLWGGAVTSWLVHSFLDKIVHVQALTRDIVLGQDTFLSLCFSPPRCIKWVPVTFCWG